MAQRRRTGKDLTRKTGSRPERRTILIFCEGEASEPDYIGALKSVPQIRSNTAINLVIDPSSAVPLKLVEKAVARKQRDSEIDECWCVFDVEWPSHHPNLDRALRLADAEGINVAVSNPCFELWLILHFQSQTGFLDNRAAEALSTQLDGRQGKRIDGTKYMSLRHDACARASALAERHDRDGTAFPNDNPSSSMHRLLATIEASRL
ncbi:RloB family protein [Kribbella kalugense]|uniref:RloB-like protein n=1 Tax=Kribbella kalugense TaxID=2512221 RepID=A0A4R7ZC23_9ACTN|nr:RloB family protein [Kribbella kalugense]TDW15107.1 RloB-like protein [Kribbella kalugense]